MTCIVGMVHHGIVTIGGDSAGTSSSHQQTLRADPKIFRVDNFLFGCTSSFRMMQLLRYSLDLPKLEDDDIFRYMVTVFIAAVRDCFKNGGYATTENGQENGGRFLVGVQGHLFRVQESYQVEETLNHYDAIGSGDDNALGALYALQHVEMQPGAKITLALEAAAAHNSTVRPPFLIESI
jgi:hypothetical protein